MAVKKKAGKKRGKGSKVSPSNPKGAGRPNKLGENPRLFTIPLRNEDRLLLDEAAAQTGDDLSRLGRRALFAELRRLGLEPSGDY